MTSTPDLKGRFLEGVSSIDVNKFKDPGLPNITGGVAVAQDNMHPIWTMSNSAIYIGSAWSRSGQTPHAGSYGTSVNPIRFDASRSNAVYKDNVTTVQPASYTVRYFIRAKP